MAESVKAIAAIKVLASWLNLDVELMLTGLRAIAGHFSRSHVSAPPNV